MSRHEERFCNIAVWHKGLHGTVRAVCSLGGARTGYILPAKSINDYPVSVCRERRVQSTERSEPMLGVQGANIVVFRKDWRSPQETLLFHDIAVMYKLNVMILGCTSGRARNSLNTFTSPEGE